MHQETENVQKLHFRHCESCHGWLEDKLKQVTVSITDFSCDVFVRKHYNIFVRYIASASQMVRNNLLDVLFMEGTNAENMAAAQAPLYGTAPQWKACWNSDRRRNGWEGVTMVSAQNSQRRHPASCPSTALLTICSWQSWMQRKSYPICFILTTSWKYSAFVPGYKNTIKRAEEKRKEYLRGAEEKKTRKKKKRRKEEFFSGNYRQHSGLHHQQGERVAGIRSWSILVVEERASTWLDQCDLSSSSARARGTNACDIRSWHLFCGWFGRTLSRRHRLGLTVV